MKKEKLPKSTQQTLIVFEEIIRRTEVADAISKFRETMGIPYDGIEFTEEDEMELTNLFTGPASCAFYVPARIPISEGYLKYMDEIGEKNKKTIKDFRMTIVHTSRSLVASQGYTSERLCALMRLYVIFNRIIEIPLKMFNYEDDLLRIEHLPSTVEDYGRDDQFLLECMYDHFDEVSRKYPVAIYINPEATLNQVKDFISKKWSIIEGYREKEKTLYAGKRNKPRQKINDFIYDNQAFPIAEIRSMLAEVGEYLDDGHIGKILSLEKKRRESK